MGEEEADRLVHRIVAGWREAPLSPADRALCAYAARLTAKGTDMTETDLGRLRGEGLSDRAIHDAVQVIAFFNYITRVADGLGVQPETFIGKWGLDE